MIKMFTFALLAAMSASAVAQGMVMATPVCPRDAEPIPAALSGWTSRSSMTAAKDQASVLRAAITQGVAVDVELADTPAVAYVARPSHPGSATSHGGMVGIAIATAGTYRVAVGAAAWVDVVKDKVALDSVGHGRGPSCSGIRKMVDFALQPGTYVVQIVGNAEARIPVLVAKLP